MAVGGAPAAPHPLRRLADNAALAALLVFLGLLSALLAVASQGNPGLVAAPFVVIAALYLVWKVPLRWTALAVVFLLMAPDDFLGGGAVWRSPFAVVGQMMRYNIDQAFPQARGFKFSGLEMLLGLVLVLVLYRRATGNDIDRRGQVQTAGVLRDCILMYFAVLAFCLVSGLTNGGTMEVAIWQVRPLLQVAFLFLFFQAAFRGPVDHLTLARLIIFIALIRAALCLWVAKVIAPTVLLDEHPLNTASSHGDSVLFTVACVALVARVMERPARKEIIACLALLPPLFLGMVANHRRLVWVQLGLTLMAIYFISPWNWWKRGLTRLVVVMAPVLALYVVAGWNGGGKIFGPVQVIRGVVDAKKDRSAWDRETENWNLAATMAQRPFIGRGFGTEWLEIYKMDDITAAFPQYHAQPHNQVLGLLLFGGLLGFTCIWFLLSVGIFLAVRAYNATDAPVDRATALTCVAGLIAAAIQNYGDLGVYFVHTRVVQALAIVVAGKLAVATGAWPKRTRVPEDAPKPPRAQLAVR